MFIIQQELKKLPEKPGVYLMKDDIGDIIYVGKAVILKNRVRQYFQSLSGQMPKVRAMVSKIKSFEYIITHNELEALILECNLIKKYKPKFNILLKDDKSYPYIKVTTNEDFPRILTVRNMNKDGAEYFGPYSNKSAVKRTIDLLKKLFPIKSCNKVFPRDIGKQRPCLNYHISQCLGPCQGNVNKDEYRNIMKDVCNFLKGRHDELIKKIESKMKAASDNMEYELAASYRDKLASIKHIAEKQKAILTSLSDIDVIGYSKDQSDADVQIFFIRGGKLIGRENFILKDLYETSDEELISSFLKQFYNDAAFIPEEILIQCEINDKEIIEKWLSGKKSSSVKIKIPKKGEKNSLLKMVIENAEESFKNYIENIKIPSNKVMDEMVSVLGLSKIPSRIEAYDVSNTGSSEIVASMVVFENAIASPSEYRKFKIKGLSKQNDYAGMQEALYRRFKRAINEKTSSSDAGKFSKFPDLILIDGGLGHINSVEEVLKQINISIPVFGMVKNENHKTRGIIANSIELDLSKNLLLYRFISTIQNEAHRFAISYNRKLVEKRYKLSVLDEIEGIGPKRKKELLKHFGSVANIKKASVNDLLNVIGINRELAENIYNYFYNK